MQALRRSAREPQSAERGAAPLRHNPSNINSDSSGAAGSRGAGPSPKDRYIAAAKGYRNGADQTVRGKKAAIAREWGLCLLEGGQFSAGDADVCAAGTAQLAIGALHRPSLCQAASP